MEFCEWGMGITRNHLIRWWHHTVHRFCIVISLFATYFFFSYNLIQPDIKCEGCSRKGIWHKSCAKLCGSNIHCGVPSTGTPERLTTTEQTWEIITRTMNTLLSCVSCLECDICRIRDELQYFTTLIANVHIYNLFWSVSIHEFALRNFNKSLNWSSPSISGVNVETYNASAVIPYL